MSAVADALRRYLVRRHSRRLLRDIESGVLDKFLETLLKLMRVVFVVNRDFRRNIDGFEARYAFKSKDGKIACSAIFSDGRLKVTKDEVDPTNITVVFKDGRALMNFLFDRNPDVIAAILDNEITYDGNLNYLAKFAFMARHLQLMFAL